VYRDVVGVAVAADRIEGDHHLRAGAADDSNEPPHDLVLGRLRQGVRVLVVRGARHAGVAVAQEYQLRQAQGLGGAAHLRPAHLS
jgi:hypothetical protein